jgi:hypothetical protein
MTAQLDDSKNTTGKHEHAFRNGIDNTGTYAVCMCGKKIYDSPNQRLRINK